MTTCIIDVENETVYADDMQTRTSWQEHSFLGILKTKTDEVLQYVPTEKVEKTEGGHIITGAGCGRAYKGFVMGYPHSIPKAPTCTTHIYVCSKQGETFRVVLYTSVKGFWGRWKWKSEQVCPTSKYLLSGSGSEYAYGALMAGCTPEEAIKAASKCDPSTSANVSSMSFKEVL